MDLPPGLEGSVEGIPAQWAAFCPSSRRLFAWVKKMRRIVLERHYFPVIFFVKSRVQASLSEERGPARVE